jgi:hypothetical protein
MTVHDDDEMTTRPGALSRYQAGRMAAEYIASDPTRYGKWTGWHTAGINVAGSFLLGGITATPSIDVRKVNGPAVTTALPTTGLLPPTLQGLSPRAKLMMGVGYVSFGRYISYAPRHTLSQDMYFFFHSCLFPLLWSLTVSVEGT